ncbi:MAG: ABC transporter permease [Planctomycetota bacterium]|jgi:putative ABC transport system permease protein
MNNFIQDLRYAFRMLLIRPGFTAVVVLTLALGIGANTAIFSVVNAVLLLPLPYSDPDQLTMIWQSNPGSGLGRSTVSPPNFIDWRNQSKSFQGMSVFRFEAFNLSGRDEPERLIGTRASASLFSVLGAETLLGRTFRPEDDQRGADPVVVLSHALWERRFGSDQALVGRTLTLSNVPHTVVGITLPGFAFPRRSELWVPYIFTEDELTQRGSVYLQVIGRLRPGVALRTAQAEMDAIAGRLERAYPESNTGWGVSLVRLHEQMVSGARPTLLALFGAAGFVLLVACANVANLLLARASFRTREIAIRVALGASRSRVFAQLLTESVVLALVGGGLGMLVAFWGTDMLTRLAPTGVPRLGEAGVDTHVVGFAFAVSVLTAVLFGVGPALQGSRYDLHDSLKEGGWQTAVTRRSRRLRQSLVVAEFAIAFVLLVGAGLMIRSIARMQAVDPGFDPRGTVATRIDLPASKYAEERQQATFFKEVVERIEALPGVRCAGAVTTLPLGRSNLMFDFTIEGRPRPERGQELVAGFDAMTPHYFRTMGIPLVRGRVFTERDDASAPLVAVINTTMARTHWPGEDPVGQRIAIGSGDTIWEIVGVVGDVKHDSLTGDARSAMFIPLEQAPFSFSNLVVRAERDPMALASAIRGAVWSVDPHQPLGSMRTVEQYLADATSAPRATMLLLGVFAAVALILSAVGIYGVMSYSVSQRSHEIGVRVALGARALDVAKLMLSQGAVLVALGVGIGLGGAIALTRVLRSLLFGVGATDAATIFAGAIILTAVGLLACYVPARRAMKVDPMVALRYE